MKPGRAEKAFAGTTFPAAAAMEKFVAEPALGSVVGRQTAPKAVLPAPRPALEPRQTDRNYRKLKHR